MLTSYELHSLAMAVQICWLASPAVKETPLWSERVNGKKLEDTLKWCCLF